MQKFQIKLIHGAETWLIIFCFVFAVSGQKISSDKIALEGLERRIEDGKLAEVEKDLFDFVIAHPKDANGFALMARLRLKQNRLNESKSLSNKALSLEPTLIRAKLSLSLAHFQLNEIQESRDVLSSISENEIPDNSTRLNIAEAFAVIGDCQRALKTVEALPLRIRDREALPMRAGCFLKLNDTNNFNQLISITKSLAKQNPRIAIRFAKILSKGALHKEVVELLRLVVVPSSKNVEALLLLAKSEIRLKNFQIAKSYLARAEKIQPTSSELFFLKSFLESEQGNSVRSLELLEKSLELDPRNTEKLMQLVVSAMRANQPDKAVRVAEILTNLEPQNPEFLYLLGAASLQNNNLEKAESLLTKYLESRPTDSRGCLALGVTFAGQADKLADARQQLQHCLAIDPGNYEAAYQLGLTYKTQGESEKAIEYFERTVKLFPNHASGLRDLGAMYMQTGAEEKARPLLEQAVLLNPNDADAHFQLSRLYNIIGEHELGKKHLQIFQKLKTPKKDGM